MTLLGHLMGKFTRPATARQQKRQHETHEALQHSELLTTLDRYAPLLELMHQKYFIDVIPEGDNQRYQSIVLDIDLQAGYLILDELFPQSKRSQLQPGQQVVVQHHRRGQVLEFSANVIRLTSVLGEDCLALDLPKQINNKHRRQYERLSLADNHPLSVRLQAYGKNPWLGAIQNISAGGMRVAVRGNIIGELRRGDLLPLCEFKFTERLTVRCGARILCYRQERNPNRHTQLSVAYEGLSTEHRLQIQQFVNAMVSHQHMAA